MFDLAKIRNDFPMIREKPMMQGKPLVFLDNASTTFKPDCVIEAMDSYYREETTNVHRGDYDLCAKAEARVEAIRAHIARFLHAEANEIVFTSGTTDSLNLVAYGYGLKYLKKGDEIVLSEAEHASNALPWFRIAELTGAKVVFVPLTEEGRITPENLEKVMTGRTRLVSLAYVGNVLGFTAPVKELAKVAHAHGAAFCVDGAQAVPHLPIDVKELDCDFLCFSGHKMCGPTGIGILYGKYDLLDAMDPFETGGGMNVKFYNDATATYLKPPAKFEAGTINIAGIFGLGAAVTYLESIGMDAIAAHEAELKAYAVAKLKEVGGITIYNETSEAGIVTFNIENVFAQDAATLLNSKGIACRSGQHCAKMLPAFLETPATLRASFYLYTTHEDIDALVDAVKQGGNFLDAYF